MSGSEFRCAVNKPIQMFDFVALTEDIPSEHLICGQVGTVVMEHTPDDFAVDFSDNGGHTYALLALNSGQLMVLHHQRVGT